MKVRMNFIALLIISSATSCDHFSDDENLLKESAISQSCFEVSYVTGICSQAVLKIENPDFYRYGEKWENHSNVFFTVFDCDVNESQMKQGRFLISLIDKPEDRSCFTCFAALDYNGAKKYHIKIVDKCN